MLTVSFFTVTFFMLTFFNYIFCRYILDGYIFYAYIFHCYIFYRYIFDGYIFYASVLYGYILFWLQTVLFAASVYTTGRSDLRRGWGDGYIFLDCVCPPGNQNFGLPLSGLVWPSLA